MITQELPLLIGATHRSFGDGTVSCLISSITWARWARAVGSVLASRLSPHCFASQGRTPLLSLIESRLRPHVVALFRPPAHPFPGMRPALCEPSSGSFPRLFARFVRRPDTRCPPQPSSNQTPSPPKPPTLHVRCSLLSVGGSQNNPLNYTQNRCPMWALRHTISPSA
jgi:hypothetical protein